MPVSAVRPTFLDFSAQRCPHCISPLYLPSGLAFLHPLVLLHFNSSVSRTLTLCFHFYAITVSLLDQHEKAERLLCTEHF